jgi:SAM-dependent methyltransferase
VNAGSQAHVFKGGKRDHDFEAMYANEDQAGYDSWRQGDLRHLRVQLAQTLIAPYNFGTVLDIGCGKGTVTQHLKRANNYVIGVDCSPTAIEKARATFPDIRFACVDALTALDVIERFDLVSIQGVLTYIEDWRAVLDAAAKASNYLLSYEYVPAKTLGAVKTCAELIEEIGKRFSIIHRVVANDEIVIVLAQAKH